MVADAGDVASESRSSCSGFLCLLVSRAEGQTIAMGKLTLMISLRTSLRGEAQYDLDYHRRLYETAKAHLARADRASIRQRCVIPSNLAYAPYVTNSLVFVTRVLIATGGAQASEEGCRRDASVSKG